jgi:hypothetical protein
MQMGTPWETESHSTSQDIPRLLCSPKAHYSVHNSLPIPRACATFLNKLFLRRWVVGPSPKPQGGGPTLTGCQRLLIQHIRSYPSHLEAVSSIRHRGRATRVE